MFIMEEKKRTRVKFSKVLYYILLVIFAGTFCVSLFLLGRYWDSIVGFIKAVFHCSYYSYSAINVQFIE